MFSPPNYSDTKSLLSPRRGPWTMVFALHQEPILHAVRAAAPLLQGRLLDVGCGNKPYASILQCSEHLGVDVASSLHNKGKFDVVYDGKGLPFEAEEFDSILCTEVLEHCAEPTSLMAEMARVLRPGGFMLITVPMVIQHHEEPYDFHRFTKYGMERLVKQAGLQMEWMKPRGGLYATSVALLYTMVGYTISRRPISDLIYWTLWPFAEVILQLEKIRNSKTVISLGWQTLVRKPLSPGTPAESGIAAGSNSPQVQIPED